MDDPGEGGLINIWESCRCCVLEPRQKLFGKEEEGMEAALSRVILNMGTWITATNI